jgi:GlcNAc-P-P-Und epimerase
MSNTIIIFGGTGFIGLHFTRYLLDNKLADRIVLADIKPPDKHIAHIFIKPDLDSAQVIYEQCDVRQTVRLKSLEEAPPVSLICNFAAVHREPGHESHEYYETNIPGSETVTAFAEQINCSHILFTSSISPYGPTEDAKDESVIPTPETAYGGSKLAAELIHKIWWNKAPQSRKLLIVRPGVVFGPGEGGNVSRLVRLITKGFFIYAGNQDTRKAGIYVKELCHGMFWLLNRQGQTSARLLTANMTMNPGPSMQEYVDTICNVMPKKVMAPSVPPSLLMLAARLISTVTDMLGIQQPVNPVRVRKLIRSNNILPGTLQKEGYQYVYSLKSALADWKEKLPSEWR